MYQPDADRYSKVPYARSGRSGLDLPRVSLGLWHNFGGDSLTADGRAMILNSFDNGITHFDLANNYGPPAENVDFRSDELDEIDRYAVDGDINLWAASSEPG
jgi:L-glyceraldehyde 3-phosphate reductase